MATASPATGAARMNVCQIPVRHYQWYQCEQCGSPYLSNALRHAYCSHECKRIADREKDTHVDILDQAYNIAGWLVIKDATPEDEGGFFNGRSKISTTHLEAMGYDRSIAEGTELENVKTHERKVVDYSNMPYVRRELVTVGMFLRDIRQGE